jgi:predicted phage tail component-like protein
MSLTIDGKKLSELKLALLPGFQHPAAPPVRDYTVSIPGRPGAYYFGSDIDPLEFNLPLIIKPQEDRYKLAAAIRKMVAAFIDPYGKPKEVKLIYDYEPDKYYLARYSGSMPIDRYFRMGKFELPLIAYDPHAYSILESTKELHWNDSILWMSDIPFNSKKTSYTVNSPQRLAINNFGTMVVRPMIEIRGSADNFALTINNEKFSFGTLANAFLLIDAEKYAVMKDGKNFLFQINGDLEKLILKPGMNLSIISGTKMNLKIDFKFNPKYK